MRSYVLTLLLIPMPTITNAGEMSAAAQEIWDNYRYDWCENAREVAGYPISPGQKPLFEPAPNSYQLVKLSRDGTLAEIIYPGDMQCNGYLIYTSVGGNTASDIVVNGEHIMIFGGEPFVMPIDKKNIPAAEYFTIEAFIAWWGWGGACSIVAGKDLAESQGDCLNFIYYDEAQGAIVFPNAKAEGP